MAKESMIYVFGASRVKDAEKMIENTRNIRYPSADVKSLQSYIPSLIARLELKDGRVLLAFSKHENMYPLESFGSLKAAHAEWILSRLENLCCLFEFNDVVHDGINFESVCINPFTHELAIYGGWWKAKAKLPGDVSDLISIRSVSKKVMGTDLADAPKPFIEFLESKPASNAFDDFKAWDEVIEKKLGDHNFTKFDI